MAGIDVIEELLTRATLAGRVDEEMIRLAEAKLSVQFPTSYRLFLSRFGAAICPGFEIAGLFDVGGEDGGPPLFSDVVTGTLQKRRSSHGAFSSAYVPISDDGGDYTFCLATGSFNAAGECPVVVVGPGADSVVVADDFFAFLVRSFDGSIAF